MNADLAAALSNYDGKSAQDIEAIYQDFHKQEDLTETLMILIDDSPLGKAASWCLKRHLSDRVDLLPQLTAKLSQLRDWETVLHMLQCFPYFRFSAPERTALENFVRSSLDSPNKFVRAWAYNGFHELALQFPEYAEEAESLLLKALEQEAPSVKARIRKILSG